MLKKMEEQSEYIPNNNFSSNANNFSSISGLQCRENLENNCFKSEEGNDRYSTQICDRIFGNKCDQTSRLGSNYNKKSNEKLDKNPDSDEYKHKREKNNLAVRKSREKAKKRLKTNEQRINELFNENEELKKQIEFLSKLMNGMRLLLKTFGYTQEKIDFEVSKAYSKQNNEPNFNIEQI